MDVLPLPEPFHSSVLVYAYGDGKLKINDRCYLAKSQIDEKEKSQLIRLVKSWHIKGHRSSNAKKDDWKVGLSNVPRGRGPRGNEQCLFGTLISNILYCHHILEKR